MARDLIKVKYEMSAEELKGAIDFYLMYKDLYNRDMDTMKFEVDESGNVVGANLDIWL